MIAIKNANVECIREDTKNMLASKSETSMFFSNKVLLLCKIKLHTSVLNPRSAG